MPRRVQACRLVVTGGFLGFLAFTVAGGGAAARLSGADGFGGTGGRASFMRGVLRCEGEGLFYSMWDGMILAKRVGTREVNVRYCLRIRRFHLWICAPWGRYSFPSLSKHEHESYPPLSISIHISQRHLYTTHFDIPSHRRDHPAFTITQDHTTHPVLPPSASLPRPHPSTRLGSLTHNASTAIFIAAIQLHSILPL